MAEVFATIICPAAVIEHSLTTAAAIPGGEGMFTAGLSPSGTEPATHYIASGLMPAEIVEALTMCEVSELTPSEMLEQAGLKQCSPA